MNTEVIKSFLVGLGFGVDDTSLAKFNKAILSASLRVTALYASIKASAAGIFYSIAKISQGFEEVGYNLRLVAPAVNKMLLLRAAMLDAYKRAGIDLTKVVRQSILFNFSLAKTKFALEAAYKSVAVRFLPLLTKQMDNFRRLIFANMPKIQGFLEHVIQYIFRAFNITVQFGARLWDILGRLWDVLKQLDEATGGWSTKILGFIAVWKLLNLEFLLTPLGAILAGLTAIVVLYDDFKVWQNGGKSFFNWKEAVPIINSIEVGLKALSKAAVDAMTSIIALFHLDLKGAWSFLKDVGKDLGLGSLDASNIVMARLHPQIPQPLLPQQSSSVNQKLQQETNINIQGTADAHATGRVVAEQQSKVNFDLTRNMRTAAQ